MPEKNGNKNYFFLTGKEEAAMKVLWSIDKPLSATEIAEGIPERNWPVSSIQSILRTLEKKKAIEVAQITKIGKSYGRLFHPTLSANEYAAMQFERYYQPNHNDYLPLISSLLGKDTGNANNKDIIDTLQTLLVKYKEE